MPDKLLTGCARRRISGSWNLHIRQTACTSTCFRSDLFWRGHICRRSCHL